MCNRLFWNFTFRTLHVNKTKTRFFTGSPPHQNETRKIPVTNTFNMTIVVFNITTPSDVSNLFTVSVTFLDIYRTVKPFQFRRLALAILFISTN